MRFLSYKYPPAGKAMLMLGKVQFELQKLVDSYVSPFSALHRQIWHYSSLVFSCLTNLVCSLFSVIIFFRQSQFHQSRL